MSGNFVANFEVRIIQERMDRFIVAFLYIHNANGIESPAVSRLATAFGVKIRPIERDRPAVDGASSRVEFRGVRFCRSPILRRVRSHVLHRFGSHV